VPSLQRPPAGREGPQRDIGIVPLNSCTADTNWQRDQIKVARLLASVPVAQGGQKENWSAPPLAGASDRRASHVGRLPRAARENCSRDGVPPSVWWRATADEDGHYSFTEAL